jgi:hypothetical protein
MKTLKAIICSALLFFGPYAAYCESADSSGVIVIGASEAASSIQSSGTVSSEDSGSASESEAQEAPLPFYEISGSKIGNTKVSQGVLIPAEAEVVYVDGGISKAFSMVKVEANGKETQVLDMSPERSVGHKLAKGTYKVYPKTRITLLPWINFR